MIRFSAALVAVAIGVLIGGIAASELVLVYIAIVLSAVALVVLAIGVALRREELFGEGTGLAPAHAGASPAQPAHAGEGNDQGRSNDATPPPLQGAAVGPGAAFAGASQAASPQSATAWDTQATRDPWPSPVSVASAPTAWQGLPGGRSGGWHASDAGGSATVGDSAAQEGVTVPRPWGAAAPSAFAPSATDAPAAVPSGEPGTAKPSWFSPSGKASSTSAPASGDDSPSSVGDAVPPEDKAHAGNGTPGDAAALDEDDDWPGRYSWLDDEPEEAGEEKPADELPDAVEDDRDDTAPGDSPVPDDTAPKDVAAPEAAATRNDAEGAEADADVAAPADPDEPPTLHLVRGLARDAEVTQVQGEPGSESPVTEAEDAGDAGDKAPGTGLVTVVPGVPRFHQEDCVLIRFMPEGDTQKLSIAQAKEAGCTPCTVCQAEG